MVQDKYLVLNLGREERLAHVLAEVEYQGKSYYRAYIPAQNLSEAYKTAKLVKAVTEGRTDTIKSSVRPAVKVFMQSDNPAIKKVQSFSIKTDKKPEEVLYRLNGKFLEERPDSVSVKTIKKWLANG